MSTEKPSTKKSNTEKPDIEKSGIEKTLTDKEKKKLEKQQVKKAIKKEKRARKAKKEKWRKLDNAAKVFPATANASDTRVFRFYCQLEEEVEPEHLQRALDLTLEKYPVFLSVLRRGLFWFYMERDDHRPMVKEEYKEPCSNLYEHDGRKYLFRVNYYKNRINLEVFHVLTDGTGATQFLTELVKNYLDFAHYEEGIIPTEVVENVPTLKEQENDGFSKYYTSEEQDKRPKKKKPIAYQIHGIRAEYRYLQVEEGVLSVQEVLTKAREHGVSMTVYLTAVLLCAIQKEMSLRQMKRPVILMVPVNLRKFFPSDSMLNFFGYIEPGYHFQSQNICFEEVLQSVKEYFKEELTLEHMADRMNEYTRLEKNPILKFAPLELKNIGIYAGFRYTTRDISAIFSNMSSIKMPEVYEPYIHQFGVFTSTPKVELCMCSFQDRLVLNFTSQYDDLEVQHNFFKLLKQEGIAVEKTKEFLPEPSEQTIKGARFVQWISFITIALAVLCVAGNALITPDSVWSIIAVGALATTWVAVVVGFRRRRNLLKNAIWQLLLISIVCVIWDIAMGWRAWSVDYVMPLLTLFTMIFMIITAQIQKLESHDYMIYYVMADVFGLVSLPLMFFHVVQFPVLAIICACTSFLFLTALAIFRKHDLMMELKKKLHV